MFGSFVYIFFSYSAMETFSIFIGICLNFVAEKCQNFCPTSSMFSLDKCQALSHDCPTTFFSDKLNISPDILNVLADQCLYIFLVHFSSIYRQKPSSLSPYFSNHSRNKKLPTSTWFCSDIHTIQPQRFPVMYTSFSRWHLYLVFACRHSETMLIVFCPVNVPHFTWETFSIFLLRQSYVIFYINFIHFRVVSTAEMGAVLGWGRLSSVVVGAVAGRGRAGGQI